MPWLNSVELSCPSPGSRRRLLEMAYSPDRTIKNGPISDLRVVSVFLRL
jgi:hypothetical protein